MRDTDLLAGELPAASEEVIRQFEQAWQGGGPPDLDDYLPAAPGPGQSRLLAELIHVDLDVRLRRGEPARVEQYLERFPGLGRDRAALLGLIAAEYELRHCWQAGAAADEFLRRFPQFADELRDRLRALPA